MRRTLARLALGLLAAGLSGVTLPAETLASTLCRTRTKTLIVRESCKRNEQAITPDQQVDLGFRGPPGPTGPVGVPLADLKVLDASGHEVGLVISTSSYQGTAEVVGALTVPGSPGSEFFLFSVNAQGVSTPNSTCSTLAQYFRTSDCTGEAFASCEYGNCSSVSGAFLARPLFPQDSTTVCYLGAAAEFQRGDFYQLFRFPAPTPQQAAAACTATGGSLVGPAVLCKRVLYCAPCCRLERSVGVAPVHTLDASLVGTPPFRLSR